MNCEPPTHLPYAASRQRGMVLAIVLILLLVMTIIGLTAAQSTALQERMSGNQRDRNIAFQSAEYTLRLAQADMLAAQWTNFLQDTGGLYTYDPTALNPLYQTVNWNSPSSVLTVGGSQTGAGPLLSDVPATNQPEFIIEQMPPVAAPGGNLSQMQYSNGVPPVQVYQVYTRATGGDTNAQVMLQATLR